MYEKDEVEVVVEIVKAKRNGSRLREIESQELEILVLSNDSWEGGVIFWSRSFSRQCQSKYLSSDFVKSLYE